MIGKYKIQPLMKVVLFIGVTFNFVHFFDEFKVLEPKFDVLGCHLVSMTTFSVFSIAFCNSMHCLSQKELVVTLSVPAGDDIMGSRGDFLLS